MRVNRISLFAIILFLCFNISYCQEKTVYEKKVDELSWQFYKNLGVSQSQINFAEKTHNTEEIDAVIKKLWTTNEGYEKYSRELIKFTEELKKAEMLKTDFERKMTEQKKNKIKELEDFNKSDYATISKNIKAEFEKWLTKSEFEKQIDFIQRLNTKSQKAFDSICASSIQNSIKSKIYDSKKPELEIRSYDADKEFFNVRIKIFNTEIEDTLNIKISQAEKFKNDSYSRYSIDILEGRGDWFISDNNLLPKELSLKVNDKLYSKNIKRNLQNIKTLDFNSKDLGIVNEQISDLYFDYTKHQEEMELNRVHGAFEIDVKPDFPGGMEKFYKYLNKNFKVSNDEDVSGKIFISFIIEKDGSLTDVKVIKAIVPDKGDEAVRVIKSSPKWIPGESKGKKVRCSYMLTINI